MTVDYDKVGLLAIRDRRMLLCRKKRGTSLLILPGGCIESGESVSACLTREIEEELGENVRVKDVEYLGTYRDVAAGDGTKTVQIRLYRGELEGEPTAQSEIAELVWFASSDDRSQLSHVLMNKILPDLNERGIWR